MKKFSRPLTINIMEQPHESSPAMTQSQHIARLQFRETTQNLDSEEEHKAGEQIEERGDVVQFEEYNVDEENKEKSKEKNQKSAKEETGKCLAEKRLSHQKYKKEFSIEIPEIKNFTQSKAMASSVAAPKTINHFLTEIHEKEDFKEPPAPSHKSSIKSKSFVFPTNQPKMPSKISTQIKKNSTVPVDQQYLNKMEEMVRGFQRERQQFYREKSRYEKELMVKDGQIEMLQKIVTNKFGNGNQSDNANRDQQNQYQAIVLEKDLQITQLLQKINELNEVIEQKNEELNELKLQCVKGQSLHQSLRNQLYVFEKKEANDKLTKQFFFLKKSHPQKSITPTSKRWQDDGNNSRREQPRYTGIEDLQKRLQTLKMNRLQYEDRSKIKSQIAYSQSTKNRSKGAYDLKGLFYDRQFIRAKY